jgi:hypothetical protein
VSDTFKLFLLLHIASIILAFAPVVVGAVALAPGGRRAAVPALSDTGRIVYSGGLIAAGLFGILLVLASDDAIAFDQIWVSLAFVVWLVMNGVFHAMIFPSRRGSRADRAQLGLAIMDVLLIVMLYLMIWQPGR